jgi:pimeloyl-ACP methyl ester carboxylesterase
VNTVNLYFISQIMEHYMNPLSRLQVCPIAPILLSCVFLFTSTVVLSQGNNKLDEKNLEETMRNPWKADRSVFLQEWLLLGSIPVKGPEEIDKDFLSESGGEATLSPVEGQTSSVLGTEMKWKAGKCQTILDLQGFYQGGRTEDAVAYAYTTITRKEAGKVFLSLGSDDGIKVWFNGKMIHRVITQRGLTLDEDGLVVDMNAGENHLMVKIQQSKGGWGFAVRMLENPNQFDFITGNIEFSLNQDRAKEYSLTVISKGNLDQSILKQPVQMEIYSAGGKVVFDKTISCNEPVDLNYKNWPDGVYEFRFTYKDIRGTTFVKYTSWYKGDILTAARKIVQSAPGKEIRTPEASTHRMLADKILDRLGGKLDNPDSSKLNALHSPLMEYAEITTNSQIRSGGFVRLAYIDDIDNTPQFCRSYLPLRYDPAKKWPLVVYLHGYNQDNPEYINWWSADKRHDPSSDKFGIIYIEPHGRGNTQYNGIGDRDVLKCIKLAKQKFNVADDQVYLMGSSMGGFGTWNVATRHPEVFAAIAPIYGGGDYHVNISRENIEKMSSWEIFLNDKSSQTSQMESLVNMPILVSHGDRDQSVNVNLSRYLVRMLQRWNYNVRYIEVPGKGHEELGLSDQIIPWMLEHKRNSSPRLVRVRAADLRNASAYWVEVIQNINPCEFMVVDAEVLEGNIIRVDSKNVSALTLTPDKPLLDYSKPVRVVWNGKADIVNMLPLNKIILKSDASAPRELCKTPQLAGPVADFQNTPFLIVLGTTSSDALTKKVIEQKAAIICGDWKAAQKYEPRVKKDVDVTEADMKQYSLFLLGGPKDNKISKLVSENIPIEIHDDEIIMDGKSFKGKDAVINVLHPNPYNNKRYIDLVASTSGAGLSFFDSRQRELFQYDYYIVDGKIPNFSAGAKSDKIMIASGFFNNQWKLDKSLLNEGNEELRSKCAYTIVNDDLTTTIVSAVKPSRELMELYAGTYQVNGGPLLKIYLEKDRLRVAQGSFIADMHPTSENEFYIKEVNVFFKFIKDEKTNNYTMSGYQGGEFTTQRVK